MKNSKNKNAEKNTSLLEKFGYIHDYENDRYLLCVGDNKKPVIISRFMIESLSANEFRKKIDELEDQARKFENLSTYDFDI